MPITPFLKNHAFEPEQIAAMGVAFRKACLRLDLSDTADRFTEVVAAAIIRIAKTGESDPDRLCHQALMELGIDDLRTPSIIPGESDQAR